MKELVGRGIIEDSSLIEYIIDGIQDYPNNKIYLYEAKTLKQLI